MDATILEGYSRKPLIWLLVLSLVCMAVLPATMTLADVIGGYMSEKLMGRTGVADSSLVIERTGVVSPALDMGLGPVVTTQAATNVNMDGGTSATLHGTLTDLNGFPTAIVYFEWGYDLAYGHVVGVQTLAAPGAFTTTINGFAGGEVIHFRSAGDADGTNYGSDQSFSASSPGFTVVNLLPLVFALFGIILIFMFKGSTVLMMITGFITVIGTIVLMQLINSLF